MSRPAAAVLASLLLTGGAAGCGGEVEPIRGDDAPAVTAPGTTAPYEAGGADGSGADGTNDPSRRGGIVAGPNSAEPGRGVPAGEE
jgi:hypothetical protein